jgi:CHAD domain-containing protein
MRAGPRNLERYAQAQLQARLDKLALNLRRTARRPEGAEDIHDLRVAIRRFTQGLRAFRYALGHGNVRQMRRPLRKIMNRCGAARNADVALEVLKAAGAPANGSLKSGLEAARSRAGRDLAEFLKEWKIASKMRTWRDWLAPEAGPNQTIASAARRSLRPLARQFLRAGALAAKPRSTPREMHRFRLLGKRLRYTLEIFQPMLGSECKEAIEAVRKIQEYLGAINDCAATADLIAQYGAPGAATTRAKAALRRLLAQRVETFRAHWREHFKPKEKRRWLDWIGRIE